MKRTQEQVDQRGHIADVAKKAAVDIELAILGGCKVLTPDERTALWTAAQSIHAAAVKIDRSH